MNYKNLFLSLFTVLFFLVFSFTAESSELVKSSDKIGIIEPTLSDSTSLEADHDIGFVLFGVGAGDAFDADDKVIQLVSDCIWCEEEASALYDSLNTREFKALLTTCRDELYLKLKELNWPFPENIQERSDLITTNRFSTHETIDSESEVYMKADDESNTLLGEINSVNMLEPSETEPRHLQIDRITQVALRHGDRSAVIFEYSRSTNQFLDVFIGEEGNLDNSEKRLSKGRNDGTVSTNNPLVW